MKADSLRLLERAQECLNEAEVLLASDLYLGVANRAYYSIFDCARALLYQENISAKTHQGVHTKFNELFILPGKLDSRYNELLSTVFQMRQLADYDVDGALTRQDAEFTLESAREFLARTNHFFGKTK